MTIRLGMIGFGTRAHAVLRAMRALAPSLEIVGIVDPAVDKVKEKLADQDRNAPFFADLSGLMHNGKPDALLIGTRCHLHTPYAIEAAKYRIPIYLEKPVAINLEQALQLEDAFERYETPVLVSFPLRTSPLCSRARELIADGKIGRPVHFTAENLVPYGTGYFWSFYREYATTQGLLMQKATHDFDYLMYLAGAPITRIATIQRTGGIYGGEKASGLTCSKCPGISECPEGPELRALLGEPFRDHDCPFGKDAGTLPDQLNEDASGSLFEFASGAFGSYTQAFFTRREGRRGVVASGYEGTISFDWYQSELKLVEHHMPLTSVTRLDTNIGHFGGDAVLAKNFLDMVRSGAPSLAPLSTGLQSVYVCLAARTAALNGTWETVRQVGQCN